MVIHTKQTFCLVLSLLLSKDVGALGGACNSNDDCLHGGSCDQADIYESACTCKQSYTGPYCETPIGASFLDCLADSDCQNGGICNFTDTGTNTGICDCNPNFYGYHCQERCPCMNGGTCKTSYATGLHECQCPEEFYDPLCSTRWEGEIEPTNKAKPLLISLLAVTFGLICCIIYLAASSRAANDSQEHGRGLKSGKQGVERTPDGRIVYSDGEEQEDVPTVPSSGTQDAALDDLKDLELT